MAHNGGLSGSDDVIDDVKYLYRGTYERKGPTNKVLIIFRKQICEQNSFMYHNKVFYATKLYNKTQGSESVRVTVCNRP